MIKIMKPQKEPYEKSYLEDWQSHLQRNTSFRTELNTEVTHWIRALSFYKCTN